MQKRRRWVVISLAGVAAGVATLLAPSSQNAVELAASVQRATGIMPVATRMTTPISELPAREAIGKPRGDLFATRSWAPVASAPQEPVAPTAPPNPFRFAGTTNHEGKRKVFLILGDRVFEAREGEALEQGFRVQSVTPEVVTLVYEPLDVPVTITLAFPDGSVQAAAQLAPAAAAAGPTAPPARPPAPK